MTILTGAVDARNSMGHQGQYPAVMSAYQHPVRGKRVFSG